MNITRYVEKRENNLSRKNLKEKHSAEIFQEFFILLRNIIHV
jgi:hypothetical protein